MNPSSISPVTQTAHRSLIASLGRFRNTVGIHQNKALFALVDAMTTMAQGKLKGRWSFPIPTGGGKTRAIIEWATVVSKLHAPFSMVVSASRIEALCTLKRDMVANGVPESQIGLIYAKPSAKGKSQYSEPCTEDNENRPFLLCSHQLIRARECNLALYNTYKGKQRSLVVYDESLFISDIETFPVQGLCKSLGGWIGHFQVDRNRDEHVDLLNWMTERKQSIEYQLSNFEDSGVNELPAPAFTLSLEREQHYARFFRKAGDHEIADFLSVNGLPLRMFKYGKAAVITYRIVIPEALQNMIVLDASYPIRQLEKIDSTLKDAETLPFCQRERISFDNLKRFDHVTLYRMANRGSRTSAVANKTKMKRLMQDAAEVIKSIPTGEGVLVFVYKDKDGRDPQKALKAELAQADLEERADVFIETWGNETSLNSYAHCKHVILVGILHRDLSDLAAQYAAQLDKFDTKVDGKTLQELCLSERTHCAYQALSRGCLRVMGEPGQASAMTGYIVEFEDGLETELNKVMQGATWKEWKPVFSDAVEHGKMVVSWSEKVRQHLTQLPETVLKVSTRRLKDDLKAETVDKNTWLRAIKKALSEIPQWSLEDRSLLRQAS